MTPPPARVPMKRADPTTEYFEDRLMDTYVFERHESSVRYYCRSLPRILTSARGAVVADSDGGEYIDLLSACGSLNYGHNEPSIKRAAIDFLTRDGLVAALDFHTDAKLQFMTAFQDRILAPRSLDYRMQFPGPTGANCVEAALKLARKFTGRQNVVAFTNAFHGVSAGALSVTGSRFARRSAAGLLFGTVRLPFEGYSGAGLDDIARFERMACDPSGGIDPVAAVIVEVVQGEGGLNVASPEWLRALASTADRIGALLVVDEIQTGCGRTGRFFGFEEAGIVPDIVCMAKSISGLGLPMSLLLMRPDIDCWEPGEHNGTFRGNSVAFASAAAALRLWDDRFEAGIRERCERLSDWCAVQVARHGRLIRRKGKGMMQGLEFDDPWRARSAAVIGIRRGVLLECCGPEDEVLKIMAPLNIDADLFREALERVADAVSEALSQSECETESSVFDRATKEASVVDLQGNEAPLDPAENCSDAVAGTELPHGVA